MTNNVIQYPLNKDKRNISLAYLCNPLGTNLKHGPEALELRYFKILPSRMGFDHRKMILDSKVEIQE